MPESPAGFDTNRRLYAQMRPDDPSLDHLLALQEAAAAQPGVEHDALRHPARARAPRPVPRRQLHLTLIHFGKVLDVHRVISTVTGISLPAYEKLLPGYIARTEALLPGTSFRLQPVGAAGFGAHGRTLVVEYEPAPELTALHSALLQELESFLGECGITDTGAFMAQDANFMYARTLRPHITLVRGYTGPVPALDLEPVTLASMPVVYPGH